MHGKAVDIVTHTVRHYVTEGTAMPKGRPKGKPKPAFKETGLDEEIFPDTCPYSWDDIVSREFSL